MSLWGYPRSRQGRTIPNWHIKKVWLRERRVHTVNTRWILVLLVFLPLPCKFSCLIQPWAFCQDLASLCSLLLFPPALVCLPASEHQCFLH